MGSSQAAARSRMAARQNLQLADELLRDPELKTALKAVLEKGVRSFVDPSGSNSKNCSVAASRRRLGCFKRGDRIWSTASSQRSSSNRSIPRRCLCLSKIKSEHIRGAIRRGLGGKECALPSSRCAIGARPYPRPSACASHYSGERKISECGADAPRPRQ
jgi:hypothetical protein